MFTFCIFHQRRNQLQKFWQFFLTASVIRIKIKPNAKKILKQQIPINHFLICHNFDPRASQNLTCDILDDLYIVKVTQTNPN